jgi:hypothetical protein
VRGVPRFLKAVATLGEAIAQILRMVHHLLRALGLG